jgi:hypothetical protein
MKDSYENDTIAQREALINEFKGNLFEFLVARELANKFEVYTDFIAVFVQDRQKQQKFQQYESWLREHAPEVISKLPTLAQELANKLTKYIKDELNIKVIKIDLVGKSFDKKLEDKKEADILLYDKNNKIYPLSLKLCKKGSYVNTKSAGVSSFLQKYFSSFSASLFHQEELNLILDQSFNEMGQKLYEQFDMRFNGKFGPEWISAGLSELPGQLDANSRKIVHASYTPVIKKIYLSIEAFNSENPDLLCNCLLSILGYSQVNMIQALCFHQGTSDYSLDQIIIDSFQKIEKELSEVKILPLFDNKASFEIQLKSSLLQIRVKPMNKFTSKSHKINCSYKRRNVSKSEH